MREQKIFIKVKQKTERINNILFILFLLAQFIVFACAICPSGISLDDASCFDGIIKLNHLNYRAGQFASKKNMDLIVEYSGDPPKGKRLFYGWKANGRGYFNENYIKEKDLSDAYGRYESRNIFVSKKTDTNKEKEYLFSTSSYQSWTELHNLETEEYKLRNTDTFNNGKRIFSYVYTLLETKISNENYYFLFFTTPITNEPESENGEKYIIKKFAFTDFSLESYDDFQKSLTEDKFGDRVITGFILEEYQAIVILLLKKIINAGKDHAQYNIRIYDYSCNLKKEFTNYNDLIKKRTDEEPWDIVEHVGYYANSLYLSDNTGLFIYFHVNKLIFQCYKFTKSGDSYSETSRFFKSFDNQGYDSEITLNAAHKINDNRVAFISTKNNGEKLYIFLLDFYDSYANGKIRIYNYNLFTNFKLKKEMAVYSYKGNFLAFSSTIGPRDNDKPYTSFLLFFSYPNGTDFSIDISVYLKDSDNYDPSKNLFSFLLTKMKIENNILRYEKVEKIRLVTIPNQILVYNGDEDTPLPNESIIDSYCVFKQNKALIKTNQNYDLYYQYVAKEPDYNDLYYSGLEIHGDGNYASQYIAKEVYGRTNKLTFKLCHDYCEECYELGPSNNDQYCISCLSEYTYDYLAYMGNFTGNCVPMGDMYDIEAHQLLQCEGRPHKYYLNSSRNNEKYCFKYSYECPDVYQFLNTTNNECLNYTPPIPTTILEIIPTTLPINLPTTCLKIPTTIPKYIPTTIVNMPTTFPEYIPSTLIRIPTTIAQYIPSTIIKIPTTVPIAPTTIIKNPTTVPIAPTTINKISSTVPITPSTIVKISTIIPDLTPTTLPEKMATSIPISLLTTIPINLPTTIITTIPEIKKTTIITDHPTIIYDCNYYTVYHHCIFTNLTNEEIFNEIKQQIVTTYPIDEISVLVNGSNSYSFQLTNTNNENNALDEENSISTINLGKCEITLRNIYNIEDEYAIIILKYFKSEGASNEKSVFYELYHPITFEKLNLSYCANDTFELNIPIELDEDLANLFSKILNQGYNIFDPDDDFYRKICTPYTSDNGTDVLLDDRVSFYQNKVQNLTTCPDNCKFISYSIETKYLKCECGINDADISTLDFNNIIGSNTYKSFYSTLKYSNYKVMICYNLVFNFKIFCHNYGSIMTLVLFIIYLCFIIVYLFKNISP